MLERDDELNPGDGFPAEPRVIGDEHVAFRDGGTGELDRIGRLDGRVYTDRREHPRRVEIERNQRRSLSDGLFVLSAQIAAPDACRADENFANGEARGEELIPAAIHRVANFGDALGRVARSLEQVNVEIRVPENAAHSHPSRSFRMYSSGSP